jgi:hypothetical protein
MLTAVVNPFPRVLSQDPPYTPTLIDLDDVVQGDSSLLKLRGVRAMGGGISLESMLAQVRCFCCFHFCAAFDRQTPHVAFHVATGL